MAVGGTLDPLGASPLQLLVMGDVIRGHPSGTSQEVEDTMHFSVLHGIRPMTETVPLEDTGAAYQRMLSGAARLRMVVTTH